MILDFDFVRTCRSLNLLKGRTCNLTHEYELELESSSSIVCMRSLLKPTRSLSRKHTTAQRVLFSDTYVSRFPRRDSAAPARPASRTHKRASSSSIPAVSNAPIDRIEGLRSPIPPPGPTPPEEPAEGPTEKGKPFLLDTRLSLRADSVLGSLPGSWQEPEDQRRIDTLWCA